MDNRPNSSKKLPKFATTKMMFTPNLGYKRIAVKDSDQQSNVEIKIENDSSSGVQSSTQKQKKTRERSTTQIQSVFSNMTSASQGRVGSCIGLSSGFRSSLNQSGFNNSGLLLKSEACQSIQQMQMFEKNQLEMDDPMDGTHKPIRLSYFVKDRVPQVKIENSLEYPIQKKVYPVLTELISPESLMTLQFYDSSFSVQPKCTKIDLTSNEDSVPIKSELNGHIKTENDPEAMHNSQPIGKMQYYKSGRVVLVFNGKEYELLKANDDKLHKELFSLTNIDEDEKPDKLVSLGTNPLRLKAVMGINSVMENF